MGHQPELIMLSRKKEFEGELCFTARNCHCCNHLQSKMDRDYVGQKTYPVVLFVKSVGDNVSIRFLRWQPTDQDSVRVDGRGFYIPRRTGNV